MLLFAYMGKYEYDWWHPGTYQLVCKAKNEQYYWDSWEERNYFRPGWAVVVDIGAL